MEFLIRGEKRRKEWEKKSALITTRVSEHGTLPSLLPTWLHTRVQENVLH